MRLFAILFRLPGEKSELLYTTPCENRAAAERLYPVNGLYTYRLAEFVEVAHAPTDRPPPNTEVPADSLHGPGGTGC